MINKLWRRYYDVKAALEILDACTAMAGDIALDDQIAVLQMELNKYANLLAERNDD